MFIYKVYCIPNTLNKYTVYHLNSFQDHKTAYTNLYKTIGRLECIYDTESEPYSCELYIPVDPDWKQRLYDMRFNSILNMKILSTNKFYKPVFIIEIFKIGNSNINDGINQEYIKTLIKKVVSEN